MGNLPINSDSINKSLDIIQESTKETRNEIDKTASKGINKLAELFWASPLGIKADVYIAERPYKMEKALEEMKQKYKKVPSQYQVEPTSYIALKGVTELNYSLDEQHLREMFQNLLVSDMDSRKKNKVLPSYIEIIKQLSKEDAAFLKMLKEDALIRDLPILRLKSVNSESHFQYISPYILCLKECHYAEIPPIIFDNLLRLRLIAVPNGLYVPDISNYDDTFEIIKSNFTCAVDEEIYYSKEKLIFTELGKNFIDICLS